VSDEKESDNPVSLHVSGRSTADFYLNRGQLPSAPTFCVAERWRRWYFFWRAGRLRGLNEVLAYRYRWLSWEGELQT